MAPILPWIQEYLGPGPLTVKRQNVEVLGLGPIVAGVQVALLVLCTAAVGLRVWARGWVFRHAKVWGWDDTLTVLGYVRTNHYLRAQRPYQNLKSLRERERERKKRLRISQLTCARRLYSSPSRHRACSSCSRRGTAWGHRTRDSRTSRPGSGGRRPRCTRATGRCSSWRRRTWPRRGSRWGCCG